MTGPSAAPSSWTRWLHDPRARGLVFQLALVLALAFVAWEIAANVAANLAKQNIASGFAFLDRTAGFDISQSLIDYKNTDTYARAFWVGLSNTVLVAAAGIALATVLGFALGIARLSSNWLLARLATVYVEIIRNVPLLLQLFVWYVAVLRALPAPRESWELPFGAMLNLRGLTFPRPVWQPGSEAVALALVAGVALAIALRFWAERRQRRTGQRFPAFWIGLAFIVLVPLAAFVAAGMPIELAYPRVGRFNVEGGIALEPEFAALVLGLATYTAAFIAEIVRAGIAAVPRGQKEAAAALGLHPGLALRLVVIPLALRVIIPPLTNQYLNLTKNSSLAVAIGYPDLVSVFAGTVLNQTGQAVEAIAMTMAVYLMLSLLTSALMNWFNARMALVER